MTWPEIQLSGVTYLWGLLLNYITNYEHLAASVFGELWKLEPLPEDKKANWRKEMDWLLSPTNYMVELVPAKQTSSNGRTFEVTPWSLYCNENLVLVLRDDGVCSLIKSEETEYCSWFTHELIFCMDFGTDYFEILTPNLCKTSGCLKQIMTPKARADVHMNLPALQKIDSMLIVGAFFILIPINLLYEQNCHDFGL